MRAMWMAAESHVALVYGDVTRVDEPVLVRVHTHCLAGDVFGDDAVRLPGGGGRLAADDCGGGTGRAGVSA